ncbi:MAG: DUF4342 domain-containing protein [Clostridia bacterium]|nr:DUF4342 domain-containing protein [Clostridia bacterium]
MDEQKLRQQAEQIVETVKELVKDGSASRVLLKRKGETLLNLSLNTGILGAVIGLTAAPFAVLTAALVSFGFDCEIEIEKKDGTVLNLNETEIGVKMESWKETAFDKAREFFGPQPAEQAAEPQAEAPEAAAEEPAEAASADPEDDPAQQAEE